MRRYDVLHSTITGRSYLIPFGDDTARAKSQRQLDADDKAFCLRLAGGRTTWFGWFNQLFTSGK